MTTQFPASPLPWKYRKGCQIWNHDWIRIVDVNGETVISYSEILTKREATSLGIEHCGANFQFIVGCVNATMAMKEDKP